MKSQRKKKGKQESPLLKGGKAYQQHRYQFNISYDNLKCFINPGRMTKGSRRKIPASSLKSKPSGQRPKSIEFPQLAQKTKLNKNEHQSPDWTRQVSNSILQRIETQGIFCKWEQQPVAELTKQQQEEDKRIWKSFSESYSCKSYASTADLYHHKNLLQNPNLNLSMYNYYPSHFATEKSRGYDPNNFIIDIGNIENDPRTTIMIRNVPNKYSVQDLSAEIDAVMDNIYDFLYLPCDLKNQCNVGYGFINLIDKSYLKDFYRQFHSRKWLKFRSQKICMLTYAKLQGLQSLIEHFQNSKVLNQKDKKYRPIIREMDKIQHLIKKQQGHLPNNVLPTH